MISIIAHLLSEYFRILFAEFFVAGAAYFAWALAARLKRTPLYLRWCAWAITFLFWLTIAFHVLLNLRIFTLPGAIIVSFFSWALGFYFTEKEKRQSCADQAQLAWRWLRTSVHREKLLWLILPAVGTQVLVCFFIPPLSWDYQTYHGVKAAWWVQQGGPIHFEAPGGWSYYQNFFAQGSIMYAWSMLLFHSDRLVVLTCLAFWPLFLLAVYALARELGVRPRPSWLIAWFVASIPAVLRAKCQGWIDISMQAEILCALVFCLHGFRRRTSDLLAWQGMAIGMTAATKLTGLSLAAILTAAPLLLTGRTASNSLLLRRAILAAILCALPVVPWMARSYFDTGYPLSPFPVAVAGITLGKAAPEMAWYLQQPVPGVHTKWLGSGLVYFIRIFCSNKLSRIDPFMVPFLMLAPIGLMRLFRENWRGATVIALLTFAFVDFYISSSFTVVRVIFADSDGRFFLSMIAWAIILGYRALPARWWPWAYLYLGVVIVFELTSFAMFSWPPVGLYMIATGCGVVFAVWYAGLKLCARWQISPKGAMVFALIPLLFLASFAAYDALRIYSFRANMETRDKFQDTLGIIDHPGHAYRIALTSGPVMTSDQDFYYPMLGTELQNQVFYIPISQSGRIHSSNDPTRLQDADYPAWLQRLQEKKIDYFISFSPRSIELDWMEGHPQIFQKLAGSDDAKLDHNPFNGGFPSGWGFFRLASSTQPLIQDIPPASNW